MITFTQFLLEARKNPKQNKKVSTLDQLKEIKEKYGTDNIFVTFTQIPKLGANPQSEYDTPLGIYSYPLEYVLDNNITEVPFAGEQPYIIVFKNNSSKIWKFSNDIPDNVKTPLIKIMKKLGYNIDNMQESTNTNKFWRYFYRELSSDNTGIESRKLLRLLGITGIVDPGLGILHPNEPTQAVFFDTKNIKIIQMIHNDINSKIILPTIMQYINNGDVKSALDEFCNSKVMRRVPRLEKILILERNANYCIEYCVHIGKRIKEFESIILETGGINSMIKYSSRCINGRWPELETILLRYKNNQPILTYYQSCCKVRWPEYEQKLLSEKKSLDCYDYIKSSVFGRWPEAEPILQLNPNIWKQYSAKYL